MTAPLPASQVVEGGVQVRVTKSGLKTITGAAKELIASFTAGGICIPAFQVPAIEGFTLGDLRLSKVRTSEDDFLAINPRWRGPRANRAPSPARSPRRASCA